MFNKWIMIPGYNGYEINDNGQVRSFKHFNSNANGIFLKIYNIDNPDKSYVILTNNNNGRDKVKIKDIFDIIKKTDRDSLYIRGDNDTYRGSRNRVTNPTVEMYDIDSFEVEGNFILDEYGKLIYLKPVVKFVK